jgi:hypothetical protein
MQPAYDRMQPACDRISGVDGENAKAENDRIPGATQRTSACGILRVMQAALPAHDIFNDRMQPALRSSVPSP